MTEHFVCNKSLAWYNPKAKKPIEGHYVLARTVEGYYHIVKWTGKLWTHSGFRFSNAQIVCWCYLEELPQPSMEVWKDENNR